ncbi:MAG TPA: lipopolysaccharide biosynthesis protein, partial [Vicinamibacteria bacterium]|jgi:UDP-N-acetylmuramyl pentapeptide phosphotransferase/UDP-N-acetylglucosamine-1-phosphate transferase
VILAASVAGGCAGFLPFNWAPARIFLGDVGSGLVGYTLATIPFLAPPETREKVVLLVGTSLWLFLADATTCLLRRVVRERRWYEPHRQHLYQRWVIAGASHARVTSWMVVGSAATSVVALLAWRTGALALQWGALALGTALFALEWRIVRRREMSHRSA